MFNCKALEKLISILRSKGDEAGLGLICDELETFVKYHSAIYCMETKLKMKSPAEMGIEDYKFMVETLDKERTMLHNRVLIAVNVLNRMAERENVAPVYDGIVSEERPYRKLVADAVLDYVENVVKNRR